jgi:hypothetical protein
LWTIAAGPLVNVVLFPVLLFATEWCGASMLGHRVPDLPKLLHRLWELNRWLLLFNLLPIFPLDGGQILRSLLWFRIGRARSLWWATIVGFIGIAAVIAMSATNPRGDLIWTVVLGGFIAVECYAGFKHARVLLALEGMPVHAEFLCAACRQPPPAAALWGSANAADTIPMYFGRARFARIAMSRALRSAALAAVQINHWRFGKARRSRDPNDKLHSGRGTIPRSGAL